MMINSMETKQGKEIESMGKYFNGAVREIPSEW